MPGHHGRAPNLAVRNNFARCAVPNGKVDHGICKHCHWRRSWHSTNLQKHLDDCARYQVFLADGEPEDELEQRTQDAWTVMMEVIAQQPTPPPAEERPAQQAPRQQPHVTVERPPRQMPQPPLAMPSQLADRERMMEAVLGMVWSALAATGSPETQPNTALWNLVGTVAPNALKLSHVAPRRSGVPGQYTTPSSAPNTAGNAGRPSVNGRPRASQGPQSDSTYQSEG